MGFEPGFSMAAPATDPVVFRARIRRCRCPPALPQANDEEEKTMRSIGLDIHRDFCEVAIAEGGEIRSPGRIEMTPAALELLGASLCHDDRVALEVSGNAWRWPGSSDPTSAR